jgi:protease PrsW
MTATGTMMTAADSMRAVRATAALACAFGTAVLCFGFFRFLLVFPRAALLAVVLELPLLLVGFVVLRLLRPIRSPDLVWSAAALIWGATAAAGCALLANQGLVGLWAKSEGAAFASNWSASLSAPLNEEVLKLCGVVLLVLAAPLTINGPLDGMVYGSLVGLGFQVVENVTYGLNSIPLSGGTNPERSVLSSALLREGITSVGSHWTMTAVAGAGVGFFVHHSRPRAARGGEVTERGWPGGLLPAAACLVTAMGMHVLFDAPRPSIVIKVLVNLVIVAGMYLVLSGRFTERARKVVATQEMAGLIAPAEAGCLLSRRQRWLSLRLAASPAQRRQQLARQRVLLDQLDRDAALVLTLGGSARSGAGIQAQHGHIRDDHSDDDKRHDGQPVREQQDCGEQHRGQRKPQHANRHRADAHADRRDQRQTGQVCQRRAAGRPDEDRREYRPAPEAAHRHAVANGLAHEQQHERAQTVDSGLADERCQRVLA